MVDVGIHGFDVCVGQVGGVRQVAAAAIGANTLGVIPAIEVCGAIGLGVCHAQRVSELVRGDALEVLSTWIGRIDCRAVEYGPALGNDR